ncbi:MAG: hypothetical protein M1826_006471 [Phylliscum demangeonii]|nr:MAG: hypothetical protein M1826_006471 [Phylliscum demangeonii]
MGLFDLFSSPAPGPRLSKDGTPEAPSRRERERCYEARDAFFRCLDQHDIIDSIKDEALAKRHCASGLTAFGQACTSTWVVHFKKRRTMEHQKALAVAKIRAEGGFVTASDYQPEEKK